MTARLARLDADDLDRIDHDYLWVKDSCAEDMPLGYEGIAGKVPLLTAEIRRLRKVEQAARYLAGCCNCGDDFCEDAEGYWASLQALRHALDGGA